MADLVFKGRTSLIDGEVSWRLGPDALLRTFDTKSATIPYSDVKALQLITFSGSGGRQGRATLVTASHGTHKIGSHHYVSLGTFEDRSASYVPFVRSLAKRVRAAQPAAKFASGSTGLWLAWIFVGLIAAGTSALLTVATFEGSLSWLKFLAGAGVAGLTGYAAWLWAGRSRPRVIDPNAITDDLIV